MLFTLAWLVLGFVSTGYSVWGVHVSHYSPVQAQISALGVGNTAPYKNSAFILSGGLLILGTPGIFRTLGHDLSPRMRRWSLALWMLPGIGSIVDGVLSPLYRPAGAGVVARASARGPGWRLWAPGRIPSRDLASVTRVGFGGSQVTDLL